MDGNYCLVRSSITSVSCYTQFNPFCQIPPTCPIRCLHHHFSSARTSYLDKRENLSVPGAGRDLVMFPLHCQSYGLPRSGHNLVIAVWQSYSSFLMKYTFIQFDLSFTSPTHLFIHSTYLFVEWLAWEGERTILCHQGGKKRGCTERKS